MTETKKKYHKNPAVQKKIVALFNWFDYEKKKYSLKQRLQLIKMWVTTLSEDEEYEVAQAFLKYKRPIVLRKLKILRQGKRSFKQKIQILSRIYKMRFKSKIKMLFS